MSFISTLINQEIKFPASRRAYRGSFDIDGEDKQEAQKISLIPINLSFAHRSDAHPHTRGALHRKRQILIVFIWASSFHDIWKIFSAWGAFAIKISSSLLFFSKGMLYIGIPNTIRRKRFNWIQWNSFAFHQKSIHRRCLILICFFHSELY